MVTADSNKYTPWGCGEAAVCGAADGYKEGAVVKLDEAPVAAAVEKRGNGAWLGWSSRVRIYERTPPAAVRPAPPAPEDAEGLKGRLDFHFFPFLGCAVFPPQQLD